MTKLAQIVSKSAPVLGAAMNALLPGSGLIVSGLASLFGSSNDQQDLLSKINSDPEAALKLKQYEMDHIRDLTKMVYADIANARNREIEVTKATGSRDWTQTLIGIFIVLSFFASFIIIAFFKTEPTDHDLLYIMATQISSLAFLVVGYYFGGMISSGIHKNYVKGSSDNIILPEPRETS
jgi:hypothetical protein